MSKAEILAELPKLQFKEQLEIFDRIWEMAEKDLLIGEKPTIAEKNLLDAELEEFGKNPQSGSSWNEVEVRLRQSSPQ